MAPSGQQDATGAGNWAGATVRSLVRGGQLLLQAVLVVEVGRWVRVWV
jgi:hypothetical protein